ncbi:hypothetical protein [Flagellimonas nanhaiensis]|uniref:Uncharacterized protein n=1 Tax=Flagellimonas nanhaiensis TaxID=2292706 RepID=A0A371JPN4_9FLAO|nr:hypothetical protein [Allomuricauda nanhaiensis]RDY59478.1 hypothetical protein DX873_08830 [Allomuricauda nanhaiensis]
MTMANSANDNISIPVASPLVLNTKCLNGTIRNNNITEVRYNFPDCAVVNLIFLDNPIYLGKSAVDAMGQTFLHTPVARTRSRGAMGIRMFQNKWMPKVG